MSVTRILLIGAGRFAEEIEDLAADCGFEVVGLIEGIDRARADSVRRPQIIWVDDQRAFEPELGLVAAIGSPRRRALVERLESEGRRLVTVIHPSAVVARTAVLEPGCVVFPQAVIGARTQIGRGTIVNRGALIGHHATVGAHAFIGPGSNLAGGVRIGDGAYMGVGAIVRDDRTVGAGAMVGAGAVVIHDVEPGVTVVGIPARPLERR